MTVMDVQTARRLPPEGRMDSPANWRAQELVERNDWILELTPSDIEEIDAAVEATRARGMAVLEIGKQDIPLPTLGPRLQALRAQIVSGVGLGYVRGLPVDRYDMPALIRTYWALGTHIGTAIAQNRNGHMLGHVIALGDKVSDADKRITQTPAELHYHTDSCDVVSLLCRRTALRGGESMVVSGPAVHDEMRRRAPDLWRVLYDPIVCDWRGEVPPGATPWFEMPLWFWYKNQLSSYVPITQYVDSASRHPGAPALRPEQKAALDLFHAICNEPEFCVQIPFQPGDLQFLHNHIVYHARRGYTDDSSPERRRHLMRLWLALPDGIELPDEFAAKWRRIERGGPRGGAIVPEGVEPMIPMRPDIRAYS